MPTAQRASGQPLGPAAPTSRAIPHRRATTRPLISPARFPLGPRFFLDRVSKFRKLTTDEYLLSNPLIFAFKPSKSSDICFQILPYFFPDENETNLKTYPQSQTKKWRRHRTLIPSPTARPRR